MLWLVVAFSTLLPCAIGQELSSTNHGIYVAITGWRGGVGGGCVSGGTIRVDDRLWWCPFSTNGVVKLHFCAVEGVGIRMLSPEGREVAKTSLGATFGTSVGKGKVEPHKNATPILAQGPYDGRDGGTTGPLTPPVSDLFQMQEDGIYTLEIQIQVLLTVRTNNTVAGQPLTFHPVKFKVDKRSPVTAKRVGGGS